MVNVWQEKEALLDLKEQIKTFLPSLDNSIARTIDEKRIY